MARVRPPAVAGAFYPGARARLADEVDRLLERAPAPEGRAPKALVVPHAGYVYSGPIAASAYARLLGTGSRPTRVVLLGPSHFVGFHGLALPEAEALATPLGIVPLDARDIEAARAHPRVLAAEAPHRREHSLEVQLPFLQRLLSDFTLVPLAVGRASIDEVADILDTLWGGPETLILLSTDLSHYLSYDAAREVDGETARRILALDPAGLADEQACGAVGLRGLLEVARRRGMRAEQLDLRNSGDTAGDRSRVVGYGAFAFHEETRP